MILRFGAGRFDGVTKHVVVLRQEQTPTQSAAVPGRQRGERGLGLPWHVGVDAAAAVLEHLDHSGARRVEVYMRVVAVREVVAGEGVHERGVDAFGLEDLQQLAQIRGLLILVAHVVAVQVRGATVVAPHDDRVGVFGRTCGFLGCRFRSSPLKPCLLQTVHPLRLPKDSHRLHSTRPFVNRIYLGTLAVFVVPVAVAAQQSAQPASNSTYNHDAAPVVRAAPLKGQIDVDGKLDEPAWAAATPVSQFTQHDPHEGMPASEKTEVRILIGDDALYVGARMTDNPANIRPRLSRRDEPVDGDVFALHLDPRLDHNSGYYFRVTAGGAVRDATILAGGGLDLSLDAVWEAKVSRDATGWTAELKIPLSQIPYNRNQDTWGIQLERYSWNKQEQDLFAFTPKSQAGGVSRFGHLTNLGNLPAPRRLDLVPYASTRAEYLEVAAGNPFRGRNAYFGSAGLDLKYRITSNLALNATVNPDFGQVEVDPAVVNLTAFETFFPEKRPFFVQDRSLFSYGDFRTFNSYGEPTIFFSRRIGRSPQRSLGGPGFGYVA